MSDTANVPAIRQVCQTIASKEMQEKIRQALPPSVSLDRFTRTALTALQINPGIADGDRQSLYNAVVRAAQDGLLPDGREAALVLYNVNKGTKQAPQWIKAVQYMPMVGGLIKRLAGAGITIDAQTVCDGDQFDYELGDDAKITHKRPKLGTPRGEIIGAYAIARLANGTVMREVMDRQFEESRLARTLRRLREEPLTMVELATPGPLALPLVADRLGTSLSTESLIERLAQFRASAAR